MEQFLNGKLTRADRLAGQLIEVRNMALRFKAAYKVMDKRRLEKRDTLAKEHKKNTS